MPLRMFAENTGWDSARKSVRYTRAALIASEVHAGLVPAPAELLEDWTSIDRERFRAEDDLVDANAMVTAVDRLLDGRVRELMTRLAFEDGGRRDGALVKKYVPETAQAVIRLGLEAELKRVKRFHQVAKETGASAEVQGILKEITKLQPRGEQALASREEATLRVARLSLRMQTWKEKANAVRRSIEGELEAYAVEHKLGREYADGFFPATAGRAVRVVPARPTEPSGTPGVS